MNYETVRDLAILSRLRLTEQELQTAGEHMTRLLEHFAALEAVDTDDTEPSPYPRRIALRTRPDQPEPGLPQAEVLANAPEQRAGQFLVPRIIDP